MPDENEKKKIRKTGSIIVRVNHDERAVIDDKIAKAGYKSASAFIRDYLAREKPKVKAEIRPDTFAIQRELMNLSRMIKGNASKLEVMTKVAQIYRLSISGAL